MKTISYNFNSGRVTKKYVNGITIEAPSVKHHYSDTGVGEIQILALAAAWDEGCRCMKAGGRAYLNREDYAAAAAVFNQLAKEEA